MEKRVAEEEVIDQARFADDGDEGGQGFGGLGDFPDHVEAGIRALVREMLEAYAEDEFMRYIGARPYERTKNRRDYRNGTRRRTLRTRFGPIEGLQIPLARKVGVGYSSVKDSKIEDIVSEVFLRGVSTRKVGKITRLLWGSDLSAAEVSRMNKDVKKELSVLQGKAQACGDRAAHPSCQKGTRSQKDPSRGIGWLSRYPSCCVHCFSL